MPINISNFLNQLRGISSQGPTQVISDVETMKDTFEALANSMAGGAVNFLQDSVPVVTSDTLFVTGPNITVTDQGGSAEISVADSTIGLFDDGTSLGGVKNLDFIGTGVSAVKVGDTGQVTISAGGSSVAGARVTIVGNVAIPVTTGVTKAVIPWSVVVFDTGQAGGDDIFNAPDNFVVPAGYSFASLTCTITTNSGTIPYGYRINRIRGATETRLANVASATGINLPAFSLATGLVEVQEGDIFEVFATATPAHNILESNPPGTFGTHFSIQLFP